MSVSIATGGLFSSCCGTQFGGGGAPPYRKDEEKVIPTVLVKKVSIKTIDLKEEMYKNIKITLLSDGGIE